MMYNIIGFQDFWSIDQSSSAVGVLSYAKTPNLLIIHTTDITMYLNFCLVFDDQVE